LLILDDVDRKSRFFSHRVANLMVLFGFNKIGNLCLESNLYLTSLIIPLIVLLISYLISLTQEL